MFILPSEAFSSLSSTSFKHELLSDAMKAHKIGCVQHFHLFCHDKKDKRMSYLDLDSRFSDDEALNVRFSLVREPFVDLP